ncbi:hypothetical protein [Stutzerimonas nitrititolerans]|uniref:hypothetical protein n=1 Tax=Stutzerimonas nitrititolerans TaxID=2482751 RepID=UPI00289FE23F|nr:hypothetical protein [Stutzerimonas nitrititolerans]
MQNEERRANLIVERMRDLRLLRKQSQSEFWMKFGISQAGASRIECTSKISSPVLLLAELYLAGIIEDEDLYQYCTYPPRTSTNEKLLPCQANPTGK